MDLQNAARRAATKRASYRGTPKRLLDIITAAAAILVTALPMLICALAIYLESGGPVIFRQWRVGVDRQPFLCFKFRTMSNKKDKDGNLVDVPVVLEEQYVNEEKK